MSNEKKISLKPLKFKEAIADILKVPLPPDKPPVKLRQKKQSPPKKAG